MRLYITGYSSYRSDMEDVEVKKELKQRYGLDTRRQDSFVHLAVFGAQRLKEKSIINSDDELYITSGVGNIDILLKVDTYVVEEKESIRPIDFINILGNITSYYVAASLGMKGKNIFQISDNFTYIHSLVSVYASMNSSKKDVVLGAIDLVSGPDEVIKRVLGLDEACEVISSVNYQKLSLEDQDAIAEVEFDLKTYTKSEIQALIDADDNALLASKRCTGLDVESDPRYFETMASHAINHAIERGEDLTYIDCFEDAYKILKVKCLG